jgi:predicted MFS family arabinose efflux permease
VIGLVFVGLIAMTSSSGGDRTAFISLDTAILAQSCDPRDRTNAFVWYNLPGLLTKAVGALLIAVPPVLQSQFGLGEITSFKALLGVYTVIAAVGILLYAQLSPKVETERTPKGKEQKASAGANGIIFKMTALSAMDAFGGGLMTRAFMSFWFVNQFGATPGVIAAIFSVGQIMNVVSVSLAAPVANRIGLLNTMAFTQMFSNLFIIGIVFTGHLWVAILFFFLREITNEMDIPARQSYTMAIVPPESRTAMASVSNLGRTIAQTVSPTVAGAVAQLAFLGAPILAGSGVKIVYNILLYLQFRGIEAPDVERRRRKNIPNQQASQAETTQAGRYL